MSRMSDYDIQIDEHVRAAMRLTMETGVSPLTAAAQILQRIERLVGADCTTIRERRFYLDDDGLTADERQWSDGNMEDV